MELPCGTVLTPLGRPAGMEAAAGWVGIDVTPAGRLGWEVTMVGWEVTAVGWPVMTPRESVMLVKRVSMLEYEMEEES